MGGLQSRIAALAPAILGILFGPYARGQTALNQPVQVPPPPFWVALANALAWPVAAIVIALAFRKALGGFLSGLAARVTKLSAFKVEFELAAAPSANLSPLLDDIRSAPTAAQISDSSRAMIEQAQSTAPADFAEINLGSGGEWLTSRLFIASVMLERMRGVQVLVFLDSTPGITRRFVAVAPIAQVRWSLAQQFPWLEAAWARAYISIFPCNPQPAVTLPSGASWLPDPRTLSLTPSPIESSNGALSSWPARQLVSEFIGLLQKPIAVQSSSVAPSSAGEVAVAAVPPQSGMQPSVELGSEKRERATWVTREFLEALLPAEAFDLWAYEFRDSARIRLTRSVLRRQGSFVALVRDDREFVRLVNRVVLLEDIATSLGEEPDSNHT